jgi:hypothetical protein
VETPHVAIDDEAAFGHTVWVATWVSVPFVFIVSTLICLPGAGNLQIAALIALLPTVFAVPFVGGVAGLTITQVRQEASRKLAAEAAHLSDVAEMQRRAPGDDSLACD